jgi:Na+/H+-translocating membrane pyrophosphatase
MNTTNNTKRIKITTTETTSISAASFGPDVDCSVVSSNLRVDGGYLTVIDVAAEHVGAVEEALDADDNVIEFGA